MIKITPKKIRQLTKAEEDKFNKICIQHLSKLAPTSTKAMGSESLLSFILIAKENAVVYGIEQKEATVFWLELSMLWGLDFFKDPQYEFAKEILDKEYDDIFRMRTLHQHASDFIKRTNGQAQYLALKRIESQDSKSRLHTAWKSNDEIAFYLNSLWPEKCKLIGTQRLLKFIYKCELNAHTYNLDIVSGKALFSVLSLFLGINFLNNPQFSWLLNKELASGTKGVDQIFTRSLAYLKVVLNHA